MICRYSLTAGSLAQVGEVGSLTNAIERIPSTNFGLVDAWMMLITVGSIETELMKIWGCQPSLLAASSAWIANCGVAKVTSVFAPFAFSFAIYEETLVSVSA